jgi:hypothetical protein
MSVLLFFTWPRGERPVFKKGFRMKLQFLLITGPLLICGACSSTQSSSLETSFTFDEAFRRTASDIEQSNYDDFILSAASRTENERRIAADLALAESAFVAAENGQWNYLESNVHLITNPKIKKALVSALRKANFHVGGAR